MTIKQLQKQKYFGTDASLEVSLFEYGNACKKNKDGSFDLIYGVNVDNSSNYISFDCYNQYTESDFDTLINESWFNLDSVLSFIGMPKDDWLKCSLISRLDDCRAYYGYENIFGSSYNTFEIKK